MVITVGREWLPPIRLVVVVVPVALGQHPMVVFPPTLLLVGLLLPIVVEVVVVRAQLAQEEGRVQGMPLLVEKVRPRLSPIVGVGVVALIDLLPHHWVVGMVPLVSLSSLS
jgi:hypothetical protein